MWTKLSESEGDADQTPSLEIGVTDVAHDHHRDHKTLVTPISNPSPRPSGLRTDLRVIVDLSKLDLPFITVGFCYKLSIDKSEKN